MTTVESDAGARAWVREYAVACPCCGASVIYHIFGPEDLEPLIAAAFEGGCKVELLAPEHAEAKIRAGLRKAGL